MKQKTVLCIFKICLFVSGLIFLCKCMNYIYVMPNPDNKAILYHMYEQNGVDNLYIGSSHVQVGICPALLDELNGQKNFNLATPGQMLNASYYLLMEASRKNDISHVFLEVFYLRTVANNFNGNIDPIDEKVYSNENLLENMKLSVDKVPFMLSSVDSERYAEVFFPFTRYHQYVTDIDFIRENIEAKQSEEYIENRVYYQYRDGNGYYEIQDNNYMLSTRVFLDENRFVEQFRILDENPLEGKSKKYLLKIIEFCKEQGIELTLFITPVDDLFLICTENYDNYVTQIKELAEENQLEFYDFNLAREQYLAIPQEGFCDCAHTNDVGARMLTSFFEKVIEEKPEECDKYFYSTYEDKLASMQPAVYGVYYRDILDEEVGKLMRNMWIASNRNSGLEYQIFLTPNNEECFMLQDFLENKLFVIAPDEHGVCTINMRITNTTEILQTLEIKY